MFEHRQWDGSGWPTRERRGHAPPHAVEGEDGEDGGETTRGTAWHDTPSAGNTARVHWPATVGVVLGEKKVPPSSTLTPSTGNPHRLWIAAAAMTSTMHCHEQDTRIAQHQHMPWHRWLGAVRCMHARTLHACGLCACRQPTGYDVGADRRELQPRTLPERVVAHAPAQQPPTPAPHHRVKERRVRRCVPPRS